MAGREHVKRTPSRYSADGKWWWDGEQWHAVETGPEPVGPAPPPPRPGRAWPLGPLAIAGLIVVLALVALVTALGPLLQPDAGGHRTAQTTPTPTHRATPTSKPTPRATPRRSPSPSPSPRVSDGAYVATVVADANGMQKQIDAVDSACTGRAGLASCRPALVALQTSARGFRSDLDARPAPPCLRAMDGELRIGLGLFDQGSGVAIAGIDGQDPNQVVSGMQLIQQANAHLGRAVSQAQSASC